MLHVNITDGQLNTIAKARGQSLSKSSGSGGAPGGQGGGYGSKGGGKDKGGKKGGGRGGGKPAAPGTEAAPPPPPPPDHCARFLSAKGCNDSGCLYAHVPKEVVEENKRARLARKAAAKAKANSAKAGQ